VLVVLTSSKNDTTTVCLFSILTMALALARLVDSESRLLRQGDTVGLQRFVDVLQKRLRCVQSRLPSSIMTAVDAAVDTIRNELDSFSQDLVFVREMLLSALDNSSRSSPGLAKGPPGAIVVSKTLHVPDALSGMQIVPTVMEALSLASPGMTVHVMPGRY
jgi:hypothetical protein